ncbi:MAG: hypothetical protein P8J27_08485 [Mariniblastus sp.]|nr:hypothetical protein [Mariniblastus sp.]
MTEFDPYEKCLGISRDERPVDHYRLLGIERFESDVLIISEAVERRAAYLQDLASGSKYADASQQILNEIARARLVLADPQRKLEYDAQLASEKVTVINSWPTNPAGRSMPSSDVKRFWGKFSAKSMLLVPLGLAVITATILFLNLNRTQRMAEHGIHPDESTLSTSPSGNAGGFIASNLSEDSALGDVSRLHSSTSSKVEHAGTTNDDIVKPNTNFDHSNEQEDLDAGPQIASQLLEGEKTTQDVIFSTSFEEQKVETFSSLQVDDVGLISTGTNQINSTFAKSGSQCLRMLGDEGNTLEFKLPDRLQLSQGISFHAERWTVGKPFEFLIEVRQNETWTTIAKLDSAVQVGKRFLSHIKIPLPPSPKAAIRFKVKAAPKSGVLIDDLKFHLSQPKMPTQLPEIDQFEGLVDHFELPPTEDIRPVVVGSIRDNQRYLLAAGLFFSKESLKRGLAFSMRRVGENKRTWVVSMSKSELGHPIDIAKFWKTEFEFCFQWLDAASTDQDVNYLRNGAIKFETDRVVWLNLRKPVTIRGFQLSNDESTVKAILDIPWMPEKKSVLFEVLPFTDRNIPSHAIPEMVTKEPARMFFTSDAKLAFVWIDILKDSRGGKLQAKLNIRIDGRTKALKPEQIVEYQQEFSRRAALLKVQHDATSERVRQQQIAAVLNATNSTVRALTAYNQTISKIVGQDIPIAVYCVIEKRKMLLAKTPGVIKLSAHVDSLSN